MHVKNGEKQNRKRWCNKTLSDVSAGMEGVKNVHVRAIAGKPYVAQKYCFFSTDASYVPCVPRFICKQPKTVCVSK